MFCGNCGREIEDGARFCTYCGTPVEQNASQQNMATPSENQQTYAGPNFQQAPVNTQAYPNYQQAPMNPQGYPNYQQGPGYYQPQQPKKKSGAGLLIAIIVVVILLVAALAFIIVNRVKSALSNVSGSAEIAAEAIVSTYSDSTGHFDSEKAYDEQRQTVESLAIASVDMTDKIMYATHDGVTREEDSHWDFIDKDKAMLYFGENEYYEADYKILTGTLGMLYTDFEFPQYGLTFDELSRVTKSRMDSDESCEGYVVIVFDNLLQHNADGSTESVNSSGSVMYYGVTYDLGHTTYYDVVGANSASYYNFICDK